MIWFSKKCGLFSFHKILKYFYPQGLFDYQLFRLLFYCMKKMWIYACVCNIIKRSVHFHLYSFSQMSTCTTGKKKILKKKNYCPLADIYKGITCSSQRYSHYIFYFHMHKLWAFDNLLSFVMTKYEIGLVVTMLPVRHLWDWEWGEAEPDDGVILQGVLVVDVLWVAGTPDDLGTQSVEVHFDHASFVVSQDYNNKIEQIYIAVQKQCCTDRWQSHLNG